MVSQPDRPVGRDHELTAPPVKQAALAAGLAVTQPEKIRSNAEFRAQLEAIAPDAIVVVAYGRIIPPWMLALPRLGCINLHASLLPKYRGAAPIQWAVAMGDAFTGNTTMLLEEGLDTGPILLQQTIGDRARPDCGGSFSCDGQMRARRWSWRVWRALRMERSSRSRRITRAQRLRRCSTAKTAGWILPRARRRSCTTAGADFSLGRAHSPLLNGKKLIVHRMAIASSSYAAGLRFAEPGWILVEESRLLVACAANTWLELLEVQLEGKKRLRQPSFCAGIRLRRMRGWVEAPWPRFPLRAWPHSRFCWPSNAEKRIPTNCCAGKPSTTLSPADRNLTTALVLGVLRWQIRLDRANQAPCSRDRTPSSILKC